MEGAVISTTTLEPAQRELVLPHWHAQIELIRVLAGTLSCTVNGVERRVGAGSICMINRGQIHRIACADAEPCTVQTLMIDPSLLTGDRALRERAIEPMLDDERFTHAISSSQHALTREVANLMDTIAELTVQRPGAYELAVVAFLHLIFQKLCCLPTRWRAPMRSSRPTHSSTARWSRSSTSAMHRSSRSPTSLRPATWAAANATTSSPATPGTPLSNS